MKLPWFFGSFKKALEDYVHKQIFPKIPATQRKYLARFFTTIFSDGFETGDTSAWSGEVESGGTVTVNSNNPHHGSYNEECYTVGSIANETAAVIKDIGTSYTKVYARGYVKYANIPTGTTLLLPCIGFWVSWGSTNTARGGIGRDATGNARWGIRYYHAGTFYNAYGSKTPEINKWYCAELEVEVGTSATLRLYINGVLEVQVTGVDNSARQFRYLNFGADQTSGAAMSVTIYADCFVCADAYIGMEPHAKVSSIVPLIQGMESN